jgi:hypothetical protein
MTGFAGVNRPIIDSRHSKSALYISAGTMLSAAAVVRLPLSGGDALEQSPAAKKLPYDILRLGLRA